MRHRVIIPFLLIFIAVFLPIYLIFGNNPIDRQDYLDVGNAFGEALRQNDIAKAKSLSIDSQWPKLDEWIAQHETFNCEHNLGAIGGNGKLLSNNTTATYHYSYYCSATKDYSFIVGEIALENIDHKWSVADWSDPCERFGGGIGNCE